MALYRTGLSWSTNNTLYYGYAACCMASRIGGNTIYLLKQCAIGKGSKMFNSQSYYISNQYDIWWISNIHTGRACSATWHILRNTRSLIHHFQQIMDRPEMAANPARGQLNRENEILRFSLSPFAPENSVSRDRLSRPVPRQPAHSPH